MNHWQSHDLVLSKAASPAEVLGKLEMHGVALVTGFVEQSQLQSLKVEFLAILDEQQRNSSHNSRGFLKKGESRVARIDHGIDPSKYPNAAALFSSPFMHSVAQQYFSPYPYKLNHQVYLTHDRNFMDFGSPWHMDPTRCLKFMVYLTDTSKENGAFMYAPGSHREGFFRIMYYRRRGIDVFPNFLPDDEVPMGALSIEAPAGSLIAFEAAGIHKAGEVRSGTERMVMRGHTYYGSNRLGRFLRKILLRSPLNMARYNLCEDDYINERFKTRAQIVRYNE